MNYNVKSELRRSMDAIHFSGDDKERMVALLMSAEAPRQRRSGKKLLLGCVAVLAAAAICFGAGYAGAQTVYQNKNRVVLQQVTAEPSSAEAGQTAAGALTGEQIAAKVEDSVVAITTEIMTKSNYWFGSYVASGAGSGVII